MSDKEREHLNEEEEFKQDEPTTGVEQKEQPEELQENLEPTDQQDKPEHEFKQDLPEQQPEETETSGNHQDPNLAAPVSHAPNAPSSGASGKVWAVISLVLAVVLVVVLIKPPFGKTSGSEAVATVNGVKITKDKLYNTLVKMGGSQTLDQLITEELVKQEADKKGVKVTDADINKEMDDLKKGFSSEEEYQSALLQSGMSEADLKDQMAMNIEIRKILEPDIKITDDEIKNYFEQNKESFNTPEEVKASHILVATKEEAEEILKQLKNGADFATLAKEKSTDPGSKSAGGDLGYFSRGQMEKSFEDAAFATKPGQLSDIVKSSHGYHIIKVVDHKAAHTATLDEKKAEIKEDLINQALQTKAPAWMADLKSKAKITNTLDDQDKTKDDANTDTKK